MLVQKIFVIYKLAKISSDQNQFILIGLPYKERVGLIQGIHESRQRMLELSGNSLRLFPLARRRSCPTGQCFNTL